MDISIALARIFGFYMAFFGLVMLLRPSVVREMVMSYKDNRAAISLASIMDFILGLIAVTLHNIWVMDWRVVITVLCWITLIKGIVNTAFPELLLSKIKWFSSKNYLIPMSIICILLGAFLIAKGFGCL